MQRTLKVSNSGFIVLFSKRGGNFPIFTPHGAGLLRGGKKKKF